MTDQEVDDDVLDLTAIAAAHPARVVRLDMSKIWAEGLLSIGDIVDMAEKLGTEPSQIATVMDGSGGEGASIDVAIAIAWVIGRKADPQLSYDEVRTSWRIEPPATPPDPTSPRRESKRPRRVRASSSG